MKNPMISSDRQQKIGRMPSSQLLLGVFELVLHIVLVHQHAARRPSDTPVVAVAGGGVLVAVGELAGDLAGPVVDDGGGDVPLDDLLAPFRCTRAIRPCHSATDSARGRRRRRRRRGARSSTSASCRDPCRYRSTAGRRDCAPDAGRARRAAADRSAGLRRAPVGAGEAAEADCSWETCYGACGSLTGQGSPQDPPATSSGNFCRNIKPEHPPPVRWSRHRFTRWSPGFHRSGIVASAHVRGAPNAPR